MARFTILLEYIKIKTDSIQRIYIGRDVTAGMYFAICDDCAQECAHLAAILDKYASERGVSIEYRLFNDTEKLLRASQSECFDHYLLDIIMPGLNGIATARELRAHDSDAKIIFLSTSNEYAYQSYRVHACDYLLKPAKEAELFDLLDRLAAQEAMSTQGLSVQNGRGVFRIPFDRLSHVEVSQKHLHFHLTDGSERVFPGSLSEIEFQLLERGDFVKIHRSYIVNLNQISELAPKGCIMFSGNNLPISRLLYNTVHERYMAHLFDSLGREAKRG